MAVFMMLVYAAFPISMTSNEADKISSQLSTVYKIDRMELWRQIMDVFDHSLGLKTIIFSFPWLFVIWLLILRYLSDRGKKP